MLLLAVIMLWLVIVNKTFTVEKGMRARIRNSKIVWCVHDDDDNHGKHDNDDVFEVRADDVNEPECGNNINVGK